MKTNILLSLIIPSYNSAVTIKNLLQSINHSHFNEFKAIEAIIVDDHSKDKTTKIVASLIPHLKYKTTLIDSNRKIGPAKARNLGVKKSSGKYILFLDSDVELYKNTLKNAYVMAKEAKIKAFTGIWNWKQKTNKFFPQFKALRDWSYWTLERNKGHRYYLFSTRIAGIEKKLFNKVGGFNENYGGPTVEDIELTYKIEKVASIKFTPRLIVKHEFEDFPIIAKKYFLRTRDWMQLYLKRYRFDPVATTRKEASKPMLLDALIICTILFLITRQPLFILAVFLAFAIFILAELHFLLFLFKKKGFNFVLKSITVSLALYFVIQLGAIYGLLRYFISSRNKTSNI